MRSAPEQIFSYNKEKVTNSLSNGLAQYPSNACDLRAWSPGTLSWKVVEFSGGAAY